MEIQIDKDEDWRNSPGTSKSMTQINPPIQVGSDLCFLCCKNKISPEFTAALLEMQGIPNTTEDKLNILKVICQLLRVRWELLECLLSSHPVNLPFCVGCCKVIIEIIFLREQLFQIESDIRDKIQNIESSLAQSMDPSNASQILESDEDFEVKMEQPESYEECRELFQKEIMTEYYNKQLLQRKIEDMNESNRQLAVEFHPSLVQLHLQKNVFQIVGRGPEVKVVESHIKDGIKEDIKEFPSEKFTPQCQLSPESTLLCDSPAHAQRKAVPEGLVSKFSKDATEEFKLGLVNQPDDGGGEISDDSDYGSPSKQIKLQSGGGSVTPSPHKQKVEVGIAEIQDVSSGDSSSEGDGSEFCVSSGSEENSSDDEESDEDSSDGRRKPKLLPKITTVLPTKNVGKESRKRVYTKRKNKSTGKCIPLPQEAGTFKAKDGSIWTSQAPPKNVKTRAYNILRENGGIVGAAKDPKLSPVQLFKLMFPSTIIDIIVKHTNQYAETAKSSKDWKPLTSEELYAYIGMLMYLGVDKKRNLGANEIWRSNVKYVVPCIVATMPRDRFQKISRYLRFDDRSARQDFQANGSGQSKLGYISEIFDPFVKNIPLYFRPYDHLIVDEMLVKYRGSVRFRVYMKSKPGKYGMKIWAVCDATTGYILRLAIYEGKVGDEVERELGKKVVLGLVQNYFNSGRVVTTDNFFTSKALGVELMKHKMGLLGTLNRNRMDVIPEFAEGKGRAVQSSMFAFQKDFTMVSYVQRKNRSVVLLSTEHHSAEVNPEVKNKPQMILDYNATKGGVDTADKMIGNYTCQRATRRWPVKLFQAMIDIGALNAYIIWKMHKGSERRCGEDRRYFLRSVSESLMEPIISQRSQLPNAQQLPAVTRNAMELMGFKVPALITKPNPTGHSGRCQFCPPPRRTNSRNKCVTCSRWICSTHGTRINHCPTCKFVPHTGVTEVKTVKPRILFGIQEIPDFSC